MLTAKAKQKGTDRSTKGASKARRDQINAELQTLRSLLPILEQQKERLSYLHTMALVCFYIRETQLFPPGSHYMMGPAPNLAAVAALADPELLFSLPGFILALTANGKLAYVSENVSHFLGFSVVELLAHSESIFDLLNSSASTIVQEKFSFAQQHPGTEIEFIAEMHTLRAFRVRYGRNRLMSVRGRFLMLDPQLTSSSPALTFVAFCTPVTHLFEDGDGASQSSTFLSQHTLDMKIVKMTENVIYHLGYKKEELIGQSWYCLLHPEDTRRAAESHRTLIRDSGRHNHWRIEVRLLCKDLSWVWVQVVALRENGKGRELITCTNHILREEEAFYLQKQDPQHRAVVPATPHLQYNAGEIQQERNLDEDSFSSQEPVTATDGVPCQLHDACEEMVPESLQPLFSASFPLPIMSTDPVTLQSPQETGFPFFPAGGPKSLSCPDNADRLPSLSPCVFCSPESAFPLDSSSSVDLYPLFEEGPSTDMFPTMGTNPDPDRWAISMLAEQINSLAEIFSQYTKQIPHKPPSISLWPGQSVEDTHMVHRQGSGTNAALDFPEELSVDEEVITSILNSLLDHNSLNLSTSEMGPEDNFHVSNAESQVSLLQAPQTEATPCLDQYLCLQPLSSSVSSDTHVPDSQWDGRFHTMLQQGVLPEEAMFC
ncbi:neuronal PAS domain-containing protein 4-like [Rhineura floridana]|uniref:neuronal PAS domain-containing protein 4-like n=1 Tax=Rhineura floridana TaxID=261503 RepID=UPI002AC80B97|nr:neuronal PAS domain-containing protein 4-like [Rhineura floridana]